MELFHNLGTNEIIQVNKNTQKVIKLFLFYVKTLDIHY